MTSELLAPQCVRYADAISFDGVAPARANSRNTSRTKIRFAKTFFLGWQATANVFRRAIARIRADSRNAAVRVESAHRETRCARVLSSTLRLRPEGSAVEALSSCSLKIE